MIRDIELIKEITIKYADHFEDPRLEVDPNLDKIFGRTLFMLKGKDWKATRSLVTPAFTSSKMRQMFDVVSEIASQTVDAVKSSAQNSQCRLDLSSFFSRFC